MATPGRNLLSAPLYREPLRLVVHHTHALAGRPVASVADIRSEPFVALGPGYGMRSLTDALFREAGLSWRQRKAEVEPAAVRLFREMVLTDGPELLAGLVERRSRLASPP